MTVNRYSRKSETEFQQEICEAATLYGWKIFSVRRSAVPGKYGPVSVVTHDGKGFPDLSLFNPKQRRILYIECKREKGIVSEDQHKWEHWVRKSGGEYILARPSMMDFVIEILQGVEAT